MFSLPKDGAIYTKVIFDRCRELIAYNVWSGIEAHRLDAWIENFVSKEERYFAALVLDSLIYRSDTQTVSLARQLFQRTIPDLGRRNCLASELEKVYQNLRGEAEPSVRIVPVIPPSDPPTKSGVLIGRLFRRNLNFSDHWMVNPSEVPKFAQLGYTIIFVDDFLGTGTQFIEFVQETGLEGLVASGNCVYAPLVGHTDGIKSLQSKYSNLSVGTVETLDDSHAFFHQDAGSFPDGANTVDAARDFYYTLIDDRGILLEGASRRGFGHYELVYAFQHAVPDNSLPILWWSESSDWQPLFDR